VEQFLITGSFLSLHEKMSRGLPPASPIPLTDTLRTSLLRLQRKRTIKKLIERRVETILLAGQGVSNGQVARQLEMGRGTVKANRRRWQRAYPDLLEQARLFEQGQLSKNHLDGFVESVLQDLPRSGRGKVFTPTQEAQIVALATEEPQDYDIPIDTWTNGMLAKVAIAKGIVETISTSQVRRILKKSAASSA